MKYTFSIKRNIHMYNHLLTVSDGQMCYEAIVESAPLERETMVIWLEDFGFPAAELGVKLSGSDLSSAMLKKCEEKAHAKSLEIDLRESDFRELKQNFSETYDCVASTGNSYHM